MAFNSGLVPWRRHLPVHREDGEMPMASLVQQEMSRIFDDFFTGFQWPTPVGEGKDIFEPRLDLTETDKELKITVELPGIDEKDIDVSLSNNNSTLTIRGEKREEKEDRTKGRYRIERSYGAFQRTIPIPCEIDSDKIEATFKKGVLTVTLPKNAKEQASGKKINIKQT